MTALDDTCVELVATFADDRDRRQNAPSVAPDAPDDQSLEARVKRAKAGLYGDRSAAKARAAEVRKSMMRSGRE